MIAQQLGANWGQNFVIDNRAGASGIIGTELAAKAVPDGYTLLLGTTGTHTTNPAVFKKLPYDPLGSFAPDIPTFAEAGFAGVEGGSWYGLFAPAGTSAPIIKKLHSEVAGLLKLPEIEKRLIIEGADAIGNSPEQFAAQVKADIVKWRGV